MKRQYIFLSGVFIAQIFASSTSAQKLPKVQQASLRAPANVKVDGKATEWGKMQAYNPATEISYTIANDDKRLYLVVQAKDFGTQNMIVHGGVSLAIQKTGKKSDKDAMLVKFPYFKEKNRSIFWNFDMVNREGDNDYKIKDPDGTILAGKVATGNKNLRAAIKWIYTRNLLGIDSVLAIYNETGVEAMNGFDKTTTYTSEMAIDLKLLRLSAKEASKFLYHIVVNDSINKFNPPFVIGKSGDIGSGLPTTDFWGEYTLAK